MSFFQRSLFSRLRRRTGKATEVFAQLGLRARLLILAVVFCMFAPLAVLGEIAATTRAATTPWLLFEMTLTGLFAVALFELAARRGRWLALIPVVVVLYFVVRNVGPQFLPAPHRVELPAAVPPALGQEIDNGTLIVSLLLYGSYFALLSFLATEGVRQVRLQTEIGLAREIHEALVPPINGRFGRVEVHGVSRASSEVGGDLFDVQQVDGDVVVYLADIAGHGVPASSLAGMIKSAVRMRLGSGDPLDRMVAALNELLVELTPPNVYTTLIALRVTDRVGELCVAGHLPMLRLPLDGPPERHPAAAPPAGLISGIDYETSEIPTRAGDLLALFTDGLTEVEDFRQEQLGLGGLESVLAELRARPLNEIDAEVMQRVAAYGESHDDQTLVLVRVL